MKQKPALVLRHLAFEDLGAFAAPLAAAGYRVRLAEMGVDAPAGPADLLIVLGGPIGAYQDAAYPFLKDETARIARQIREEKPLLGICLGAQLMARALGARVYPGGVREIGFAPLNLTAPGHETLPGFADAPVLHWHGDTFDLPRGAVRLASTAAYENQAFAFGPAALGFQFHPEAQPQGFERWLIGHAAEIAATPSVDVPGLRAQMAAHGAQSAARGRTFLTAWLAGLAGGRE